MEEKKFGFTPGSYFKKNASFAISEEEKVKKNHNSNLTVRVFDWLVTVSLTMIFLGIPLFFTGLTVQGIAFEKQIYFYFWLLLALVGWAIKSVILGEVRIKRTPLDFPIIGFILAYGIATILSVDRWHSFWGFFGDPSRGIINIIAFFVAYYLIVNNFTFQRIKWFLTALILSNFFIGVWIILALLGVKFLPQGMLALAPINPFGSFSSLIIFISLMIPLIIMTIFKIGGMNVRNKIFKKIIIVLLLFLLIINFFLFITLYNYILFEGWIAILVGIVFFLVFILSRIVQLKFSSWIWLPVVVFMIIMTFFMVGRGINIAKVNLPVEVNLNYQMTSEIAKNALKQNFFFGSGPATYVYNFSLHRHQDFNNNALYNLRFFQGTGFIGEMLPTIGVVGTFFFVLLLILYVSVSIYLLARDKEKEKIYSLGFISAIVILLINAFTLRLEGPVLILGTLLAILAFAVILKESGAQEKYLNLSLKSSPKYALAFAFVFMVISSIVIFFFVFLGKVYVADIYAGSVVRQNKIDEDSIKKVLKAIDLNNKEARYLIQLNQIYLMLANNEAMKKENERDIALIRSYLTNAIAAAVKSRDLMKNDIIAIETLAQTYENSALYVPNTLSLAEEQYKKALELEPQNPLFFIKLGQIKATFAILEKDEAKKKELFEESKKYFEQSIEKKNNLALGYFHLALANEVLGNKDKAIENLNSALFLDEQNINYAFNLGRVYTLRGRDEDLKNAEIIYKKILESNEKEVNVNFQLGLLYERLNEKDKATQQYRRVLDLLSADDKETRDKIEKMIENVQQGIKNIPENADINENN